jgi:DNA repair exonuclease SbcCD ATPase subunit
MNKQHRKLTKLRKYILTTIELLSEKGIKKFIIEKYVPVFNTVLNQYLKRFDATYSVMFDNEFNESIIARGYEDLGYFSLSSGEKQRLDTALVFSFLELCRLKNSVDSNIIFFDEILDQSLDQAGIEGVFKIFHELKAKGYTIFVISHNYEIAERFETHYKVTKKKFSEIELV